MPTRRESSPRRSSIGHSQRDSSRPDDASEPATLPPSAAASSVSLALSFDVFHSLLDRREIACFRSRRDLGGHGIQIDVDADFQQRFLADDCNTLEATLEKRAPRFVLTIGEPRKWFLQALHEPADVLQPLARYRDPLRVLKSPSPSKNALRTQRDTQWYQWVTRSDRPTSLERSPWEISCEVLRYTVRNARRFVEASQSACLQKSTSRSAEANSKGARGYAMPVFSSP